MPRIAIFRSLTHASRVVSAHECSTPAGAYALTNRPELALEALERDLELGDTDHQYLAADPWFESLRGDVRFESLLNRMRDASSSTPR